MCNLWNTRQFWLYIRQYYNLRTGSTKILHNDRFCNITQNAVSIPLTLSNGFNTLSLSSTNTPISTTPKILLYHAMYILWSNYRLCMLLDFLNPPNRSTYRHSPPNLHIVNDFRSFTTVLNAPLFTPFHLSTPVSLCRISSIVHAIPILVSSFWLYAHREWLPIIHCCAYLLYDILDSTTSHNTVDDSRSFTVVKVNVPFATLETPACLSIDHLLYLSYSIPTSSLLTKHYIPHCDWLPLSRWCDPPPPLSPDLTR